MDFASLTSIGVVDAIPASVSSAAAAPSAPTTAAKPVLGVQMEIPAMMRRLRAIPRPVSKTAAQGPATR